MPKTLPNFIVIGAMKSGTTTLYEYLDRHPEVGMSRVKEPDFFVEQKNWKRGLEWYSNLFPKNSRVVGEVSPNYTKREAFPGVPERIAEVLPTCRFIFLARDPVKRAESQYIHSALSGEPLPDPEELRGSHEFDHLVDTSRYATQIEPFLAKFPKERFLFLTFESFVSDPRSSLSRIAAFLQIEDEWPEVGEIEANSARSLSRLPLWVFRVREAQVTLLLKKILPTAAIRHLKGLVSRGHSRQVARFDPALRNSLRRALAADTQRFRDVTGLRAAEWSL